MVMGWHETALAGVGILGIVVAVIHGVLTERLMAAPLRAGTQPRLSAPIRRIAALLVGSSYLFGAAGNLWATRGRHPGWALYALALVLIAYGLAGSGA